MRNWLAAVALSLPMVAVAGDNTVGGFYLGGGAADVKMRFDSGGSLDWTTAEVIGGYKHSPFVGGEARLGYGSEDGFDLLYNSLYYRTESSNDTAKTYLLLGYTFGVVKFDGDPDEDDTVSLNGFSYGAGIGFAITSRLNFNLEYRMIIDGDSKYDGESEGIELSGASLNVDYRF
jgi:hypothetical protein